MFKFRRSRSSFRLVSLAVSPFAVLSSGYLNHTVELNRRDVLDSSIGH